MVIKLYSLCFVFADATERISLCFALFFFLLPFELLCWGFEQLSCLEIHISPEEPFGLCADGKECKLAHLQKRKLILQQQLCLSFNLEQQTGNQGTVQEAIPSKLRSEISFEKTVMESNCIVSLRLSAAVSFSYFLKRILEWNKPSFRKKVYWFSLMSLAFSPLICEHLRGHFLSFWWCVPCLRLLLFQFLSDFHVLEEFLISFFLKILRPK